jgi:hypothetical protein
MTRARSRFSLELRRARLPAPVESDEITDVMAVYKVARPSASATASSAPWRPCSARPSFMYRRELGKPNADGSLTLTPHELASELSFLLTDQPPDAELTKVADSGALADSAEVEKQVTRMLAKTEVKESLRSTLISAWGLSNLFGTVKDPKLFPEYNGQLQASMFHETELFVQDVLWDRMQPVRALLNARTSFVNKPVAALYGVPYSGSGDAFVPVTLPAERAGLLTQPSVLATLARTDTTSVVARGLFVRGLLCLPKLPGPPESTLHAHPRSAQGRHDRARARRRAREGHHVLRAATPASIPSASCSSRTIRSASTAPCSRVSPSTPAPPSTRAAR